jgi:hypothetical protein
LNEYFDVFRNSSFYLFENIYFENLTIENIEIFISKYSFSNFTSSVFNSLSFIFKSSKRSIPSNRYLSQINCESNNLFSLKSTIETLTNEVSKLTSEFESIQHQSNNNKTSSAPIKLFKYLRSQCNNQNPAKSELINVTASSIDKPKFSENYMFDNSHETRWCSKEQPNQWLHFDLKNNLFKITKIKFDVFNKYIPQKWQLLVSNDNKKWKIIHSQLKDTRCLNQKDFTVDYSIECDDFYQYYKFEQLEISYNNQKWCSFSRIEFYGQLNSK